MMSSLLARPSMVFRSLDRYERFVEYRLRDSSSPSAELARLWMDSGEWLIDRWDELVAILPPVPGKPLSESQAAFREPSVSVLPVTSGDRMARTVARTDGGVDV